AGCIQPQSSFQAKSTFPERTPASSASTGISSFALVRNLGSMSLTTVAGQFAASNDTEMLTVVPVLSGGLARRRRSVFDSRGAILGVGGGGVGAAVGATGIGAGARATTGAGAGRTGARAGGGGGATGAGAGGGGGAGAAATGAPARLNTSGTFCGTSAFGGAAAFCCETNIGAIACNGNGTV